MKFIFTLVFVFDAAFIGSAQWSNTNNQFYDSAHMLVSVVTNEQLHSIAVKSHPDSGCFVIWEDDFNSASIKKNIYAQKYDKAGNRL
ncbi:MAG TPA: hypothetical protein VKI61_07970 [Chitinophagaceae bacterium]|jgi:hypothetical protein|nr:hypothetical protein [Chitinophagaceae bacterium]